MVDDWSAFSLGEVVQQESRRVGFGVAPEVLSSTKHQGLVPSRSYFRGRQIYSDDRAAYRMVEPEWFAYATNHLAEGSIGINDSGVSGCVSPMYTVFSARPGFHPGFLYRVFRSPEMLKQYALHEQASVDRRGSIRFRAFAGIPIRMPPLEEQRRIAEILDTIDKSIQATERLIAKLRSQRSGIVAAELKKIYESCQASTVDDEFTIASGVTLNPGRAPGQDAVGYLRVANVHRMRVDLTDVARLEASFAERKEKCLETGDLLIVEGHANPNEIGRCAAVPPEAKGLLYQNHLFRLRARRMRHEVAELLLNSQQAVSYWRRMCSTSSGLNTINSTMLRRMPIPVPDPVAQAQLALLNAALGDREASEVSDLDKLRQIRRGLAADLLSGRVRTVIT